MIAQVKAILEADSGLAALLTGGIYDQELSRQTTPGAFDAFKELKPAAVVRGSSETPWGPHHNGARLYFGVWLYENGGSTTIEAARDLIYSDLHRVKLPSGSRNNYEAVHIQDTLDTEDEQLNARLIVCRFMATSIR